MICALSGASSAISAAFPVVPAKPLARPLVAHCFQASTIIIFISSVLLRLWLLLIAVLQLCPTARGLQHFCDNNPQAMRGCEDSGTTKASRGTLIDRKSTRLNSSH